MKKIVLLVLILFLVLSCFFLSIRIPVSVKPDSVERCAYSISDTRVTIQPEGFPNLYKRKQWRVSARYDEEAKTLYMTCWLRADTTFSSFGFESEKLDRSAWGEIDSLVLEGGFLNRQRCVLWKKGQPTEGVWQKP